MSEILRSFKKKVWGAAAASMISSYRVKVKKKKKASLVDMLMPLANIYGQTGLWQT